MTWIFFFLSIGLRFAAAIVVLRFIPLIGRRTVWVLVALALALDGLRHLNHLLAGGMAGTGLSFHPAFSVVLDLLVAAILFLASLFAYRYFQQSARDRQSLEVEGWFRRATFDAFSASICVLDQSGTILDVNRAWQEFARVNPPLAANASVGANYLEVCDAAAGQEPVAAQVAAGLRALLRGEGEHFDLEYSCFAPGKEQWFTAHAARFTTPGGFHLVVVHEDITQRKLAEQALRENEERYRLITDNMQDSIWLMDMDLNLIYISPSSERMRGFSVDELRQMSLHQHLTPASLQLVMQTMGEKLIPENLADPQRQISALLELEFYCKDGATMWSENDLVLLRDAAGRPAGILGTGRNITRRRQAQQMLEKRAAQLALLNEIGRQVTSILAVDDVLQRAAQLTQQLFGYQHVGIFICENKKAIRRAQAGEFGVLFPPHHILAYGQGMVGWVAVHGKTLLANDVSREPRYVNLYPDRIFTCSELSVPIKLGNNILGVLDIQSTACDAFDENDVLVMETLAGQVAVALEDARLYTSLEQELKERNRAEQETRRRAEELEALAQVSAAMRAANRRSVIPPVILGQLLGLFQASGAALISQDTLSGDLIVEAAQGLWRPRQGMTFPVDEHRPEIQALLARPYFNNHAQDLISQFLPDVMPSVHALAGAPLVVDQKCIGNLWIGRQADFAEADLRLLTAISDIVANAMYRLSLHEDLAAQFETLQKTQARLVQSEKLAGIGQLVAGVAHELNNPLTSVVLYAQILQLQAGDSALGRDLERIVSEAQRASKIVHGLLEFARQRPPERKMTQVNTLLASAVDLLSYELRIHNVRVETHYASDLPSTLVDPHQIRQVFVNILTNAYQSISASDPAGGVVLIRTQLGPALFGPMPPDRSTVIRIQFHDDGPGIPPEMLPHIFDPFFTTKPPGQGTGLGLSICHGVIGEHGGHIWAESEPGKGTDFYIELPVVLLSSPPDAALESAPAVENSNERPPGDRLLLIDDEPAMLVAMQRALQRSGYRVDVASNARTALVRLERTAYDLIVCDIRMPEMSGVEFYQVLHESHPHLAQRIIFATGDAVSPATRQFLDKTGVPCLHKPFGLNELVSEVNRMLEGEVW